MCASAIRLLGHSKLIHCFPLHRKLEGMRAAVHYSLFITRGYEQDTKNERSSSATEMIIEGSTIDVLDSE